jgi:predicted ribosome quality control (RQC) complex YloA/Tae2 family protein
MRPEQQEELLSAIRGMLAGLLAPVPRLYTRSHGAPPIFSLIPLHLAKGHEETIVEDVHDAIRQTLNRSRSASFLDDQKSRTLSVLRQTIARTRRALDAMEDHKKNFARANDYEQSGSWLLAHLSIVGKGVPSVRRNEDGVDVEIPLDARLTPARNAERYFEKAKQARTALREAQVRRKALEHRLAVTEKLAASLHEVQSREMLKEYMSNYKSELSEIGIGPKGDSSPPVPFRIFTVDGGFEVWAGKSSTNNDLLTLKHARPNDLWFHARGSSGSHVILRRSTAHGEPGKKAREQAASIAAFYSKMRHAKMVPVAMTERKYVRKPKGSPPGTVVLEREKVIFAEPALPGGASE